MPTATAELKPGEELVAVAVFERRRAGGAGLMEPVRDVRVTRQDRGALVHFAVGPDVRVWHLAAGTEITDSAGRVYRVTEPDGGRAALTKLVREPEPVSGPPPVQQTDVPRPRRRKT